MAIGDLIKQHWAKVVFGAAGGFGAVTTGLGIGLATGALLDFILQRRRGSGSSRKKRRAKLALEGNGTSKDFIVSTLLLAAAVVKADGDLDELELGYLRRFLGEQFGEANAMEYLAILKASYAADFDVEEAALNVRDTSIYESRLQMIYILLGIAHANFECTDSEIDTIRKISGYLEINSKDFEAINAMFSGEMAAYYRILEVTPSASDADIREAYHYMALKFHPDKVEHLGELVRQTAENKFKKIQEAYDVLRRERGFK